MQSSLPVSAYRKKNFAPNQKYRSRSTLHRRGSVWAQKTVVDKVEDERQEIYLAEARRLDKKISWQKQ